MKDLKKMTKDELINRCEYLLEQPCNKWHKFDAICAAKFMNKKFKKEGLQDLVCKIYVETSVSNQWQNTLDFEIILRVFSYRTQYGASIAITEKDSQTMNHESLNKEFYKACELLTNYLKKEKENATVYEQSNDKPRIARRHQSDI